MLFIIPVILFAGVVFGGAAVNLPGGSKRGSCGTLEPKLDASAGASLLRGRAR